MTTRTRAFQLQLPVQRHFTPVQCITSSRTYAKAVGNDWPFPPRNPKSEPQTAPADPFKAIKLPQNTSRPSNPTSLPPKTQSASPKPSSRSSSSDLPSGAFVRNRSSQQALAWQNLMRLPNRPTSDMRNPFADEAMQVDESWKALYATVSTRAFDDRTAEILATPVRDEDLEFRPPIGLVYMKYERYKELLDEAFGFASWHLVPRGPLTLSGRTISRPYALMAQNQFIAEARGDYQPPGTTFPSNPAADPTVKKELEYTALVRCCKDLGVASELWDRKYLDKFRKK